MESILELKKALSAAYPFKIELHAHTKPISKCSEVYPKELVDIYKGLGYDGLVLTNHFIYEHLTDVPKKDAILRYIENYEEMKREGEAVGLKVYLGAEIRFTENINDYLIYGVDEEVLSLCYDYLPKGVKAFRTEQTLPKSVFLQAHPFRNGITEIDSAWLDGVESLNLHPSHNSRIGLASKYAKEHSLPIVTAGSDFHHVNRGHEGVSAMRVSAMPEDSFALAALLKTKEYLFEIGGHSLVMP